MVRSELWVDRAAAARRGCGFCQARCSHKFSLSPPSLYISCDWGTGELADRGHSWLHIEGSVFPSLSLSYCLAEHSGYDIQPTPRHLFL
jgi:hypothetical protein